MNDDYKRGLVTGIAMHPLEVAVIVPPKPTTESEYAYGTPVAAVGVILGDTIFGEVATDG